MNRIRIGMIGMGGMGRKYAEMIHAGREDFPLQLTVVCCRRQEAKDWAKEHLGEETAIAPGSDEFFEMSDLYDAVLIVTPSKTHPEFAIRAFALGKHVMIDKPSGASLIEVEHMNRAARESGKKFAIMYHHRRYRKYMRIKEMISSGELGDILRFSMTNTRYFRTKYYHQSGAWRSSWEGEGGGVLMNQGQHPMDILMWLFGEPVSVKAAIPFGKYNNFAVDDEATVFMEYPHRMTGTFTISTGEAQEIERLEISGTKGAIRLDGNKLDIWKFGKNLVDYRAEANCTERQELKIDHSEEYFERHREPYPEMLRNFGEAILKGEDMYAPGEEGIRSLTVTCASYLSAWTDQRVYLPVDSLQYEEELKKHIRLEQK